MNILILGSGGREHALAWKLKQSSKLKQLFVAPGNAGTAEIAQNIAVGVEDFDGIKNAVLEHSINMLLVGPEVPLVKGVHDFFEKDPQLSEVMVIGPAAEGARLEGSKEYAKEFMKRHNIPTAAYQSFGASELQQAYNFLETLNPPYVLKADGLAAGKGVLILQDLQEAREALREMLVDAKFGKASARVVIEEFLSGIELSCFVLTDGEHYKILPTAKDYKRIGEGDTGLNTGGMGAVSPVPFASDAFMKKVEDRIIIPTVNGLKEEGIPYVGFIFIGLIKVGDDPFVIEYNVRMGDPETEVVIPRLESDLLDLLVAAARGQLDQAELKIKKEACTTVVMVSGGYPEGYKKGYPISGLEEIEGSVVFHAGTSHDSEKGTLSNGGRVLAVTSFGKDFKQALDQSYSNLRKIGFTDAYFRKDIGFDL